MSAKITLPLLPCFPCPHKGVCCSWGTSLSVEEKAAIETIHGKEAVVYVEDEDDGEKEWRTSIVNGRCFFLLDDGCCKIHSEEYYPKVCRLFPYEDADTGGLYKFDIDICPELKDV